MISRNTSSHRRGPLWPALIFLATSLWSSHLIGAEGENAFSRTSLDVGLVVRDVEKSVAFYTKAIGFREVEGFSMPGELARNIGLAAETPLKVRVLVLGDDKSAAKLKLIAAPRNSPAIDGGKDTKMQRGFCYVTVFVADMNGALKRLNEAGAVLPASGPTKLGRRSPHEVFVLPVRDPDGNMVELAGPMKK